MLILKTVFTSAKFIPECQFLVIFSPETCILKI